MRHTRVPSMHEGPTVVASLFAERGGDQAPAGGPSIDRLLQLRSDLRIRTVNLVAEKQVDERVLVPASKIVLKI